MLQRGALLAFGENENAEAEFAKDDGVHGDVWSMLAEPVEDGRVGARFGGLAEDVGVDEEFHRVSVDSDSMGVK